MSSPRESNVPPHLRPHSRTTSLNAWQEEKSQRDTLTMNVSAKQAERAGGVTSLASPTHALSRRNSSNSLGADDEELLLQELVNMTAGNLRFVSSRQTSAMAEQAGTSSSTTLPTSAATTSSQSAVSAPLAASSPLVETSKCATAPTAKRCKYTLEEEQEILDAILAAVDGQQSSVSGDLIDANNPAAANTKVRRSVNGDTEEENVESDAVNLVLEQAKLLASSTVLCATQRGELVLHIHEHVTLRRKLSELSKTVGSPTCVAMAEVLAPPTQSSSSSPPSHQPAVRVAMGTNLGTVVLFDPQWSVLGLCGTVEPNVVNARGAVVTVSLSTGTPIPSDNTAAGPTAASGHARGVFILWSLQSFAALRVITDECTIPILHVRHLHQDPSRVLVLESSGAVKVFQFWRVMTKYMLRSTTVTSTAAASPISDMDTLPYPTSFYMHHLHEMKAQLPELAMWNSESGVPWLCAPPTLPAAVAAAANVSRTSWAVAPEKHLVAAVCNDAVHVYAVETGLQGTITRVTRHMHPPSSALSNELVRFVPLELEGSAPKVLLCVSWNTEVEVLMLNLLLPPHRQDRGSAVSPVVNTQSQSLERLALVRVAAPLLQMVPLAGGSLLLLDQNNDTQLMDVSVAILVEKHHFSALECVSFSSRLCGSKYHGCATSDGTSALLLGKNQVFGVSVYSWRERLTSLLARRRFRDALVLAKNFAEEVALSTVGLSSNAARRRRELHQYMERILLAYLEQQLDAADGKRETAKSSSPVAHGASLSTYEPQSKTVETESLLETLQHVISYCSAVDAVDLLYGSLAKTLQIRGYLPHLLYCLEGAMRRGSITYMPEPFIERFLHIFLHTNEMTKLEMALGVRTADGRRSESHMSVAAAAAQGDASGGESEGERDGRERAELALMCLEEGLPNLLRVAKDHRLLRLSVTILSHRQQQYVEALAYALAAEEEADSATTWTGSTPSTPPNASLSVSIDLVEYTLKDCALLPGADIAAAEQRQAKRSLLEYLLQQDEQGRQNLLRYLRRLPQRATRVLLFALSDEGSCSPWGTSTGDFTRTDFVSSVYFILTGGARGRPRVGSGESDAPHSPNSANASLNLFFVSDVVLTQQPGLRMLRAAELAQRVFPPYVAVHIFLSGAALANELYLTDGGAGDPSSSGATVRFDVWMDLVLQDALYAFQAAETADERQTLQELLIRVLAAPFIPPDTVAAFKPAFTRLRMARCLAALLCKEQHYAEAIACYTDPTQNRIDGNLQHDVFAMLRDEMHRLQDIKTHTAMEEHRLDDNDDGFVDTEAAAAPAATCDGAGKSELDRQTSVASPSSKTATAVDGAIKALQRGVMSQVEALVRIDATALAQFIFDHLPSNHREVMRLLRGSSVAFLDYLDELVAQGDPVVANDMNLQNTYIELLAAHAPVRVCVYLKEKGSSVTYDVQLALRAVHKYHISDASIFLLEKTMMIDEAVEVLVRASRSALAEVREEVLRRSAAAETAPQAGLSSQSRAVDEEDRRQSPSDAVVSSSNVRTSLAPQERSDATALFTETPPVKCVAELLRLIEMGKDLCAKYQSDRARNGGGGATSAGASTANAGSSHSHHNKPAYWFRFLDVFMVPRRLLSEVVIRNAPTPSDSSPPSGSELDGTGMESELELASRLALAVKSSISPSSHASRYTPPPPVDDAAFHLTPLAVALQPRQRRILVALIALYTHCTSSVLRAMMTSLDLAVVVDKVVQDNKDEAFRPFKPIILDMMSALSFELEANRLCEAATESDVMALGRELYQCLNTGIVAESDCCASCHLHLSEPPPPSVTADTLAASSSDAASSPSAVCVYACGHAYHTLCSLHAMGTQPGCYACAQRRFSPSLSSGGTNGGFAGAAGARVTDSTGDKAARAAVMGPLFRPPAPFDLVRMQRRLRQTKVKMDNADDLYPLLKTYIRWGAEAGAPAASRAAVTPGEMVAVAADNWVLAPSPRIPAFIGEVEEAAEVRTKEEKDLDVEALTDAEILELFGSL